MQTHKQQSVDEGINIVATVTVSTATAIITHPDNPYLVLVGESKKHSMPVLPGGKLEESDLTEDDQELGLSCICREVGEEIGTEILSPRCIGMANDPSRDIRLVTKEKLVGCVTFPAMSELDVLEDVQPHDRIKACYGTPDYLFTGTVNPEGVAKTEELENNHFIDIRSVQLGSLSAGHDVVVLQYLAMLNRGERVLPANVLKDFESDGEQFI